MAQTKAITKKSENISDWYNDVIFQAKLAEHGPSKGSIIIRPYGYALWENLQKIMNPKIKSFGAQNCYFPLFIPMSFLTKEKEHLEGFSPELAVVTHGGGEKLTEPLVVRPTSETIMYDAFSRWVQSYRDLPLKINQWSNVVRWEKRPYLFLRTTEFLWQEGHTAHETQEEAQKMVDDALRMYMDVYQNSFALFGYGGRKSESEKFAGADATWTYEMLMPDGKVIQGCTSHMLGQNFAKAFKVEFQNRKGERELVWQTSWGFTTRSIGALILGHGDDNGLVLPPEMAPIQVVIIPIFKQDQEQTQIFQLAEDLFKQLEEANFRVRIDNSEASPGWKFAQADLEGVPVRIEIGAKEVENHQVRVVRRDTKEGSSVAVGDVPGSIQNILTQLQKDLLERSKQFTLEHTYQVDTYDQFKEIMNTTRGFIRAFWCEDKVCEATIKEETKATTRCLPFDSVKEAGTCVHCDKPASYRWLFAQSY